MDDLSALRKGLCTDQAEANCREQFGEDGLVWACANCPTKRARDLQPYTVKMLRVYQLQQAGYPFKANDLTVDEWLDLAQVKKTIEAKKTTV